MTQTCSDLSQMFSTQPADNINSFAIEFTEEMNDDVNAVRTRALLMLLFALVLLHLLCYLSMQFRSTGGTVIRVKQNKGIRDYRPEGARHDSRLMPWNFLRLPSF